mgnify:CR=1 FL=1
MADLILKDVAKSYGDVNVLNDINLDIKTGELIVFVGPSGCGKSTSPWCSRTTRFIRI